MAGMEGQPNLLPFQGKCYYAEGFLSEAESALIFQHLLEHVPWVHDEVLIYGKRHITARKTAWYGLQPFTYKYSGIERTALPFSPELDDLRKKCEAAAGQAFNSALLNLYHSGAEGMGWHSDDEKSIVPRSAIASLSLGAARKFRFRHRLTATTAEITLHSGSLLLMAGETQEYWKHELPKMLREKAPRINITFRLMKPQ